MPYGQHVRLLKYTVCLLDKPNLRILFHPLVLQQLSCNVPDFCLRGECFGSAESEAQHTEFSCPSCSARWCCPARGALSLCHVPENGCLVVSPLSVGTVELGRKHADLMPLLRREINLDRHKAVPAFVPWPTRGRGSSGCWLVRGCFVGCPCIAPLHRAAWLSSGNCACFVSNTEFKLSQTIKNSFRL